MIQFGIDEVGRGAWAGPIVFAAVGFLQSVDSRDFKKVCIRDSKLLSKIQREKANKAIRMHAFFDIDFIHHTEIDKLGLQKAIVEGITRLTKKIAQHVEDARDIKFWIDGRRICDLTYRHEYIIKGDGIMPIISAASIVAKVERDAYMRSIVVKYPSYGFERHVGYGTREHHEKLFQNGPCEIHRKSYAPIRALINSSTVISGNV